MSAPRWTRTLLRRLAEPAQAEEALGDLEEAHAARVSRMGRLRATLLTSLEALDVGRALLRERRHRRSARRLPAISWLDVKLGLRMLVKNPALSLVSWIGMTVAVGIGTSAFGAIHAVTRSPLPFDEGDRIVTIQNTGSRGFSQERETHLHDLPTWREQSRTIGPLAAYRIVTRNLVTGEGETLPARVVEMTASGFDVTRVPPLLGRTLIAADELEGAPAVAVIGQGVWKDRFGGGPDVIGRTLQIGDSPHTIVGVMPEGYAFPINNRVWTALRLDALDYQPGEAPPIDVFGRLAPGFSLSDAEAEMAVLGQQLAAAYPDTHEEVTPRVFPYTQELFWGPLAWFLYVAQLFVSLLLVVIAINVAVLVYARTATRASEIIVRSALGASRARVTMQLFIEAFVLSSVAAIIGLVAARWGLGQIALIVKLQGGEQVPFWWDFSLTPAAGLYAFGLAVLASVIIGVVPALRVTGSQLRAGLQNIAAGSAAPKLGRIWTTLIVAQVAGAVAVLPFGLNAVRLLTTPGRLVKADLPTADLLMSDLIFEEESPTDGEAADLSMARRATLGALAQRLEREPEVSEVLLMGTSPWGDPDVRFELEGIATASEESLPPILSSAGTGSLVGLSRVGPEVFSSLRMSLLEGRVYDANDVATGSGAVVVNEVFVDLVLAGGSAVGRRIRFGTRGDPEPGTPEAVWYTIVGVVRDASRGPAFSRPEGKAFLPMTQESVPGEIAVRVRGDPASYLRRLREVAAAVDPKLQLPNLSTMEANLARGAAGARFLGFSVVGLTLSVLLLSVAGLYALMSFTVVRRRREIGIRSALGAKPVWVLRSVLGKAMWQLGIGIVAGLGMTALIDRAFGGEMLSGKGEILLPLVAALMFAVGVLAAWGPTRRGLRIHPTEALRSE